MSNSNNLHPQIRSISPVRLPHLGTSFCPDLCIPYLRHFVPYIYCQLSGTRRPRGSPRRPADRRGVRRNLRRAARRQRSPQRRRLHRPRYGPPPLTRSSHKGRSTRQAHAPPPCILSDRRRCYSDGGGSGRETDPPFVTKTAGERGSPSAVSENPNSRSPEYLRRLLLIRIPPSDGGIHLNAHLRCYGADIALLFSPTTAGPGEFQSSSCPACNCSGGQRPCLPSNSTSAGSMR